jgi:hypothetical protein
LVLAHDAGGFVILRHKPDGRIVLAYDAFTVLNSQGGRRVRVDVHEEDGLTKKVHA